MKIYISADIEGITGVTSWDETTAGKSDYIEFRQQMTREVSAASNGALAAGAGEIWINDAHGNGRNIIAEKLPRETFLIRGWSEHPYSMMQEIDDSFDAVIMIGYHSRAGADSNPLAHTYSIKFSFIKINDKPVSEFIINSYVAASHRIPVAFVSGDNGVCREVKSLNPAIPGLAVKRCIGNSTINIHPLEAAEKIGKSVKESLKGNLKKKLAPLPDDFIVHIGFNKAADAYRAAFYPNATTLNAHTVEYKTSDFFQLMRMLAFIV